MNPYRLPESVKDRNLKEMRSRFERALDGTEKKASSRLVSIVVLATVMVGVAYMLC